MLFNNLFSSSAEEKKRNQSLGGIITRVINSIEIKAVICSIILKEVAKILNLQGDLSKEVIAEFYTNLKNNVNIAIDTIDGEIISLTKEMESLKDKHDKEVKAKEIAIKEKEKEIELSTLDNINNFSISTLCKRFLQNQFECTSIKTENLKDSFFSFYKNEILPQINKRGLQNVFQAPVVVMMIDEEVTKYLEHGITPNSGKMYFTTFSDDEKEKEKQEKQNNAVRADLTKEFVSMLTKCYQMQIQAKETKKEVRNNTTEKVVNV